MRRSEKLFFVFIMIILLPSIIFAYKAFKSVENKRDTLFLKERMQIGEVLGGISDKVEEELLEREEAENRRPYYEYSQYYTPEGLVSNTYVVQKSPLSTIPDDKLIMGYFQIDDNKELSTPYLFPGATDSESDKDKEYKEKFLGIIRSKAYPTLVGELGSLTPVPVKTVSQSAIIQSNFENIREVYNIANTGITYSGDLKKKFAARGNEEVEHDVVKYYPLQYFYKKGGVFAFRKIIIKSREYIQGYMINTVYLTDNILSGFISKNTPNNFSIYSHPVEGKKYYASSRISDKLSFIKLYVYKNDNSYIDNIIKGELIEYYLSTFALFAIILVGCAFIYRTIKSEAIINQKKSDFISAVTHELKTPLTSIRMYSEMLNSDMVTDEEKKKVYYGHMQKESERLTRLINNVLDFSKLESSNKVFNMMSGDLGKLITELCIKYEGSLEESGFKFSYDISDVSESQFDKDAITQVFINLMDNAVKYSANSDTREINVRLYESQEKTLLEIADKGIGIPKGEHKAIFEKFYRIENELTRTSKGSGIGLSIVGEYVKAHGGTVEAVSKEQVGAKFTVTLPRAHKVVV